MEIKSEIFTSIINSPIGLLIGRANENGIISLEFEKGNLPITGSAEIVFEENKTLIFLIYRISLKNIFQVKKTI